jgi:hypothetical protein
MTDNALVYRRAQRFQQLLASHTIPHIQTPIYAPRWNGKVERFIRTLQDEWAYSRTWPSSTTRARSLQSFIRYYNRRRPHSSIGDRPPISRVHNVRRQYIQPLVTGGGMNRGASGIPSAALPVDVDGALALVLALRGFAAGCRQNAYRSNRARFGLSYSWTTRPSKVNLNQLNF